MYFLLSSSDVIRWLSSINTWIGFDKTQSFVKHLIIVTWVFMFKFRFISAIPVTISERHWLQVVLAFNKRIKTYSSLTKISILSIVYLFTLKVAKKPITKKQSWFCIYCNAK